MFPAERITLLREERGLTKAELAAAVHVSRSSMTEYESGATQPSMPVLLEMAAFFGVSLDYLMGLTSIRTPFSKLESQLQTRFGPVPIDVIFTLNNEEKELIGSMLRYFAQNHPKPERRKKTGTKQK